MNKTWIVFVVTASLACAMGADVNGQVIMRDRNGPNLFVSGTQGDDTVFVWENAGDLLVTVNGSTTNVTKESGVKAANIWSVGVNLFGGNDTVSYQALPAIAAGTITDGGTGINQVFEGRGEHKGSSVSEWKKFTEPAREQPVLVPADDSATVDSPRQSVPLPSELPAQKSPLPPGIPTPPRTEYPLNGELR